MPYSSKAQQRLFHYLESKGKMPKKTVQEYDHASDFEHLPEEADHGYAHGGMVEESYDEEMGEAHDFDSSGEPHTDDEYEDEHPMEYMAHGGRVKKMAKGGMVAAPHPMFAKALRKRY